MTSTTKISWGGIRAVMIGLVVQLGAIKIDISRRQRPDAPRHRISVTQKAEVLIFVGVNFEVNSNINEIMRSS